MSKTLDVFETTTGKTVKKVEASDGRIMRFADGKPINPSEYGAYKSHTPSVEKFQREHLDTIESTDDLGFPFNSRTFRNIEALPGGSAKRKEVQKNNQWVGFLSAEGTPDDPFKAAEEYTKMVAELENAKSEEKRQDIKRDYNIGGS